MNILHLLKYFLLLTITDARYSLYDSNNGQEFISSGFDCLYAYLVDYIDDEGIPFMMNYHLIPYCRRPDQNEQENETDQSFTNIINSIPFTDLYQQGITSRQLLDWSVPIDIAEQYEQYGANLTGLFHNCSLPWFGSTCQYRFEYDLFISFSIAIKLIFNEFNLIEILSINSPYAFSTCYPFLPSCYTGPSPICLDWREICDGHFNCLNGEDEEFCYELEINECSDNEYRCHYGGQCIPSIFVRDGKVNTDCLDGTDEMISKHMPKDPNDNYCAEILTFQCQELNTRRSLTPPCFPDAISGRNPECFYYRNPYTFFNIISSLNHIANETCRRAFFWTISLMVPGSSVLPDYIDLWNHSLADYCPSEWLLHPQHPILFGFFQFIYSTNLSMIDDDSNDIPTFICFNASRCPGLLFCSVTVHIATNGLNCCKSIDLIHVQERKYWLSFVETYEDLIQRCSTTGTDQNCSHPSLFHCPFSLKCISKHRLVDGFDDCYYREDELYASSCQLNETNRFMCSSDPSKCLSIVAVGNDENDCPDGQDEWTVYQQNLFRINIPFSFYCDGKYDLFWLNTSNGTDETDCQWWPCNTPNFRCDRIWHCFNGEDELNCPDTTCLSNEHRCPVFGNAYECIPISDLIEIYPDCNETSWYRRIYTDEKVIPNLMNYFLWNQSECLTYEQICSQQSTSVNDDDEVCLVQPQWRPPYQIMIQVMNDIGSLRCFLAIGSDVDRKPRRYLVTSRLSYLPLPSKNISTEKPIENENKSIIPNIPSNNLYCNRGIVIQSTTNSSTIKCLCPPNYFGNRCQWQNQRISLTIQFIYRNFTNTKSVFQVILMIIDDQGHIALYYEQILYIPQRDCNTKFNLYLLYPDRPKNSLANYSIHIDIYNRITLEYWSSWYLSIPFQFLPVNRIATQVFIPILPQNESCLLSCGAHGRCQRYLNKNFSYFCQCDPGYYGLKCDQQYNCSCSPDSICIHPSICLCPLDKFGRKCYLKHHFCQSTTNPCQNNGTCIPNDDRIDSNNHYYCLCQDGFYGTKCQYIKNKIDIEIPSDILGESQAVFVHFISAFDNTEHQHTTKFKRILFNQNNITVYSTQRFHLVFIELLNKTYYLTIIRENFIESESIQTKLTLNQRCIEAKNLFNSTYQSYTYFQRVKYYPLLCRENHELICFYDEYYMCICDLDRYSNCFTYNHNRTYDCQGYLNCENNGQCFQDNITCPSQILCVCTDCFYGTKCQFSTKGFVLSLDYILGYHIKPNLSISEQPFIIQMSIAIIIIMLLIGLINGLISISTFRREKTREFGCGIYLLISSWISILIIILLIIKFWQLVLSQMNVLTNRIFLKINCILLDMTINILLIFNDWLNVCVSIERVVTVKKGVRFNKIQSKKLAKWITLGLICLITATYIHDPLHRQLIDDRNEDEQRTWCLVQYHSSSINIYNKFITLFHFIVPFAINVISTILMIILIARYRSTAQPRLTFEEHFKLEFKQHKHRLIATGALIALVLPRLIISFISGCMKSPRHSWLFLFAYLLAFLPSMLTFIIFILPSKTYKDEFVTVVNYTVRRIRGVFTSTN